MREQHEFRAAEGLFSSVFAHLDLIVNYARSRGAPDYEAVAAEVMAIAWRRLADVPVDDPVPWLIVTARNVIFAQWRQQRGVALSGGVEQEAGVGDFPEPVVELDSELETALMRLSAADREALLLVAWEDLTPRAAAAALGISAAAFRVRLHRARQRLLKHLADVRSAPADCKATPLEET
jgi:RNA polymerase sigma-70 factor (ECF subfamily)